MTTAATGQPRAFASSAINVKPSIRAHYVRAAQQASIDAPACAARSPEMLHRFAESALSDETDTAEREWGGPTGRTWAKESLSARLI